MNHTCDYNMEMSKAQGSSELVQFHLSLDPFHISKNTNLNSCIDNDISY